MSSDFGLEENWAAIAYGDYGIAIGQVRGDVTFYRRGQSRKKTIRRNYDALLMLANSLEALPDDLRAQLAAAGRRTIAQCTRPGHGHLRQLRGGYRSPRFDGALGHSGLALSQVRAGLQEVLDSINQGLQAINENFVHKFNSQYLHLIEILQRLDLLSSYPSAVPNLGNMIFQPLPMGNPARYVRQQISPRGPVFVVNLDRMRFELGNATEARRLDMIHNHWLKAAGLHKMAKSIATQAKSQIKFLAAELPD